MAWTQDGELIFRMTQYSFYHLTQQKAIGVLTASGQKDLSIIERRLKD